MDWLTFVSNLLTSAMWPGIILTIALLFKKQIGTLLVERLESIEIGKLRLNLSKGFSTLTKVTPTEKLKESTEKPTDEVSTFIDIASSSPSAAIIMAWNQLETKLITKATEVGLLPGRPGTARRTIDFMRALLKNTDINVDSLLMFVELKKLQDIVYDSTKEPTTKDAVNFIKFADILSTMIDKANITSKENIQPDQLY